MAREIKFRAKAVVNDKNIGVKVGDFVYGSFIKTDVDAPCIVWGDGLQMEIDESTLGQFIGLVDERRAKIWEGDVLANTVDPVLLKWVVTNNGWAYCVRNANNLRNFLIVDSMFFIDRRVIGNIHDSPELGAIA